MSAQRNIAIDSEPWLKLKEEAARRNKNVRDFAGEILADYARGFRPAEKKKTKAIIIAAGMSTRMRELTTDRPKCMLEVGGKTVIRRQIDIFRQCGIDDIIVVRGYKKERINYSDVRYVYNANYRQNNILESLMSAQAEMTGSFIASYSDIVFEKKVVEALLRSKADISVVVDSDWKKNYKDRFQHPVEEAENVIIRNGGIARIAKTISPVEASGEFIGMMKFSGRGAEKLKQVYAELKSGLDPCAPFHTAPSLQRAYMTDMFQELVDRGHTVSPVLIRGNWTELDTAEDFHKASKRFSVVR